MPDLGPHTAYPATGRFITNYHGSEDMLLYLPKQGDVVGRVPIIFAHGFFGSSTDPNNRTFSVLGNDLRPLAGLGHPVAVPDLGGGSTWNNAAAMTAIDATITWMNANLGTRTDRVALWGDSMGGGNVLAWAMNDNIDRVAACLLRVPVVDLEAVRAYNDLFDAAIVGAHGGEAAYLAALPNINPSHPSQIDKFKPLAKRGIIYGFNDDTVVPPASWRAFVAATGWQLVMAPGLHETGVDTDPQDTTAFMATRLNQFKS